MVYFFHIRIEKKKQLPFAFAFPLDERLNLNAICEIKYSSASNELLVAQGNCRMKNRRLSFDAWCWRMVSIGRECLHFVPPQSNWQKWHDIVKIMIRKINDENDIFSTLHRFNELHFWRQISFDMQRGRIIRSANRWGYLRSYVLIMSVSLMKNANNDKSNLLHSTRIGVTFECWRLHISFFDIIEHRRPAKKVGTRTVPLAIV